MSFSNLVHCPNPTRSRSARIHLCARASTSWARPPNSAPSAAGRARPTRPSARPPCRGTPHPAPRAAPPRPAAPLSDASYACCSGTSSPAVLHRTALLLRVDQILLRPQVLDMQHARHNGASQRSVSTRLSRRASHGASSHQGPTRRDILERVPTRPGHPTDGIST